MKSCCLQGHIPALVYNLEVQCTHVLSGKSFRRYHLLQTERTSRAHSQCWPGKELLFPCGQPPRSSPSPDNSSSGWRCTSIKHLSKQVVLERLLLSNDALRVSTLPELVGAAREALHCCAGLARQLKQP